MIITRHYIRMFNTLQHNFWNTKHLQVPSSWQYSILLPQVPLSNISNRNTYTLQEQTGYKKIHKACKLKSFIRSKEYHFFMSVALLFEDRYSIAVFIKWNSIDVVMYGSWPVFRIFSDWSLHFWNKILGLQTFVYVCPLSDPSSRLTKVPQIQVYASKETCGVMYLCATHGP